MEPVLITYQKFNDVELANALADQLKKHHIKYFIAEESQRFNPTFAFNDVLTTDYSVKINGEDFDLANRLLKEDESVNVTEIGEDYYLYKFSDEELMDVIAKADEWNAFDVVLARNILTKKGTVIDDALIATLNKKRIDALKQPEPPQTFWIVIGYLFALCGGVLGIFIGWHLSTYKKTLPNGERVYDYNERDRKQGRTIFYISIVIAILSIGYRLAAAFD